MKKLIYQGKSKDVYKLDEGRLEFYFKDAFTGRVVKGKTIIDPGSDSVAGKISGKGKVSCAVSTHFFKLFTAKGVPNHYIETTGPNTMVIKPAELFRIQGLYNLEFVYRNNASGSFTRRYPFVPEGKDLHGLIEVTTKGDADQLIVDDALVELGIMTSQELAEAKELIKQINKIVKVEFTKKGLHLIDGKVEIGKIDGKINLIDDVTPDVFRVCKESDLGKGAIQNVKKVLKPMELYQAFFGRSL